MCNYNLYYLMNTHMNIKYWQTDYAYTYNMYMTTSNGECQQGP